MQIEPRYSVRQVSQWLDLPVSVIHGLVNPSYPDIDYAWIPESAVDHFHQGLEVIRAEQDRRDQEAHIIFSGIVAQLSTSPGR